MWNIKEVEWKAKCVIKSCITLEQFEVAKKYLDLYYNMYGDLFSYNNLSHLYENTIELIKTFKN